MSGTCSRFGVGWASWSLSHPWSWYFWMHMLGKGQTFSHGPPWFTTNSFNRCLVRVCQGFYQPCFFSRFFSHIRLQEIGGFYGEPQGVIVSSLMRSSPPSKSLATAQGPQGPEGRRTRDFWKTSGLDDGGLGPNPVFAQKNTLPETGKNHGNFRWKPHKTTKICNSVMLWGVFSSPSSVFTHVGW